jgi:hypothetical protein
MQLAADDPQREKHFDNPSVVTSGLYITCPLNPVALGAQARIIPH